MKVLTKDWKKQLDEYEQIVNLLHKRGVSSLSEWRERLEWAATHVCAENEREALEAGVDLDLDGLIGQSLRRIHLGERLEIDFERVSLSFGGYTLSVCEIEAVGTQYLAAAEFSRTDNGAIELALLFACDLPVGREYSELTIVGTDLSTCY